MTDIQKHLRGSAGASFTKTVAMLCRGQMRQVSIWTKHQTTRTGYQA